MGEFDLLALRKLFVDADSELSAIAHGRPATPAECSRLSLAFRALYEAPIDFAARVAELEAERDAAVKRVSERESEILRIRTTGHAAAHALDVLGQALGLQAEERSPADCQRAVDGLVKRAEAAEAVVERLPKTADGVPITQGMDIWLPWTRGKAHAQLRAHYRDGFAIEAIGWGMNVRGNEVYSTEAAARANAQGEREKGGA